MANPDGVEVHGPARDIRLRVPSDQRTENRVRTRSGLCVANSTQNSHGETSAHGLT